MRRDLTLSLRKHDQVSESRLHALEMFVRRFCQRVAARLQFQQCFGQHAGARRSMATFDHDTREDLQRFKRPVLRRQGLQPSQPVTDVALKRELV